jgi:enoyl-CoA hydratase
MSTAAYNSIVVAVDGFFATVTISREKALNALNREVIEELTHAAKALDANADIRVVAITGAGEKSFVAGADISVMQTMAPAEAQAFAELGGKLGEAIETSSKIWIAAVNGFAFGGGCELALACDFIYASDKAQFGQPEVKLGVIPGFGGTQRLARRVGVAKAKELCVTGDSVKADEALRIGLVDAVVPAGELKAKARDTAAKIAKNGPLAVAAAKRVIHQGQSMTLSESLALEQRAFGELFASTDQREGMAAFLGKRPAAFTGK